MMEAQEGTTNTTTANSDTNTGRTLRSAKRKKHPEENKDTMEVSEQDGDDFAASVLKNTQTLHNNHNSSTTSGGMVLRSRSREGERKKYNFTQDELELDEGLSMGGRISSASRSRNSRKRKGSPSSEPGDSDADQRISEEDEESHSGSRKKGGGGAKRRGGKTRNPTSKKTKQKSSNNGKGGGGRQRGKKQKRESGNSASDLDDNESELAAALLGLAESAALLDKGENKAGPAHPRPLHNLHPSYTYTEPADHRDQAWNKNKNPGLPKLIPFTTEVSGPSIPMSIGNIPGARQRTWKRCATHVATAYYIFYQQRHKLLQSLSPISNPGTQKFILPLSLDPTHEARMLKEQSDSHKRKPSENGNSNNHHTSNPTPMPSLTPIAPAFSPQGGSSPSTTSSFSSSSLPFKHQLPAPIPGLSGSHSQLLQSTLQPSKIPGPGTSGSPRLTTLAPSPVAQMTPQQAQYLQLQLQIQMMAANPAVAQQRMMSPQQLQPFFNMQQAQQLMRNNPALMRAPGGGVGPLNPFSSLNGATLPGLAPLQAKPPLFMPGNQPSPNSSGATPQSSSASSSATATTASAGAGQQRKSMVPLSSSKKHSSKSKSGKSSKSSRKRKQTTTTTMATPLVIKMESGTPAVRNGGIPSPPSPVVNGGAGGGIMYRVLSNEMQSNSGGSRASPPSLTSGPIPILPSPTMVKLLPNTSTTTTPNTTNNGKSSPGGSPSSSSPLPSPTFLPSLSKELPLDNGARLTTVPFAPIKIVREK